MRLAEPDEVLEDLNAVTRRIINVDELDRLLESDQFVILDEQITCILCSVAGKELVKAGLPAGTADDALSSIICAVAGVARNLSVI